MLDVRLCHNFFTLRNALRLKDPVPICNLLNCPVRDPKLCCQRNVVYELKCNKCSSKYIGSTIRDLHTRIKEHFNNNWSSVFRHKQNCKSDFSISIINRDHDRANLRLREGVMIRKLSPAINSRAESEEMSDFLF